MTDSLEALADEQLWLLAEDLKLQLEKGAGTRPVLYLLAQQRQRAVAAIMGLVNVDPTKIEDIRGYQKEAALYYDLMENVRVMLQRGREADSRIADRDRESIADALDDMTEEERRTLNVEPRGDD
jgi:hypothetical protein